MVTEGPVAPRHSLFFYLLSAPIKLGPQVVLFDVEAGLVVFGGSCFSVKTNQQEEKPFWFSLLFYPVFACYAQNLVTIKRLSIRSPFLSVYVSLF